MSTGYPVMRKVQTLVHLVPEEPVCEASQGLVIANVLSDSVERLSIGVGAVGAH